MHGSGYEIFIGDTVYVIPAGESFALPRSVRLRAPR
jgi:hypothetical protein